MIYSISIVFFSKYQYCNHKRNHYNIALNKIVEFIFKSNGVTYDQFYLEKIHVTNIDVVCEIVLNTTIAENS